MLVIDAYNFLLSSLPRELAGMEVLELCRLLDRSPWRRGPMLVVCDGNPKPNALASPVASVELIYSGKPGSADDVIVKQVNASHTPRSITVVTNDRTVAAACKRRKCRCVGCKEFGHELLQGMARQAASMPVRELMRVKASPGASVMSQAEIEKWAAYFKIDPGQVREK